jgi:hypothetical protein
MIAGILINPGIDEAPPSKIIDTRINPPPSIIPISTPGSINLNTPYKSRLFITNFCIINGDIVFKIIYKVKQN